MRKSLYVEKINRRDKLQIYSDIISVSSRPVKITQILRLANVQYNMFLEYVDNLCSAGLLERLSIKCKKGSKKITTFAYKATEMGLNWCVAVDEIYGQLQ